MPKTSRRGKIPVSIDCDTGELHVNLDDDIVVEPFARVTTVGLEAILRDEDLKLTELLLLLQCMAAMDAFNSVELTSKELSVLLGITAPALSRSLAALIRKGYLCRHHYRGKVFFLMVNPALCRKCSERQVPLLQASWEAAQNEQAQRERTSDPVDYEAATDDIKRQGMQGLKVQRRVRRKGIADAAKAAFI